MKIILRKSVEGTLRLRAVAQRQKPRKESETQENNCHERKSE